MKKLLFTLLFFYAFTCRSQDTFSICAVDPATGQVGSAGATCIKSSGTSAIIISDVHPAVGVIHTQASWIVANQNYAKSLMNLGLTPQQIIDSVQAHDAQGNPTIRQYGVVSLANGGMSAAFTGSNCLVWHNHITGPTYSIQGNILLGQQILDSMQSRFLSTQGTLACKLMAALQGAKVIGADTRCSTMGISSVSAFVRVANPWDAPGSFFLDLTVNTYPDTIDPIDTLQSLFNQWGGCTATLVANNAKDAGIKFYPNPADNSLTLESAIEFSSVEILTLQNKVIQKVSTSFVKNLKVDISKMEPGIYFLKIKTISGEYISAKFLKN